MAIRDLRHGATLPRRFVKVSMPLLPNKLFFIYSFHIILHKAKVKTMPAKRDHYIMETPS